MSTEACPACGKAFSPPPGSAGSTVRCGCGASFTVTSAPAAATRRPAKRDAPLPDAPAPGLSSEVADFFAVAKWLFLAVAAGLFAFPFLTGEAKLTAHVWIEVGIGSLLLAMFFQAEERRLRR